MWRELLLSPFFARSLGATFEGETEMKLSVESLKKMVVDETVIDLVANALVAEAKHEYTKETVEAYIKPVFESFEFYVDEKWNTKHGTTFEESEGVNSDGRIVDEDVIYLTDLKSEKYAAYLAACREAHLAGPFASVVLEHEETHGGDKGWCPALIAETELRKAKNELANHVAKEWLGLEEIHHPHSSKLVELVTGAVISGPAGESLKSPVAV